jgi:CheY-like chemotaxis protein
VKSPRPQRAALQVTHREVLLGAPLDTPLPPPRPAPTEKSAAGSAAEMAQFITGANQQVFPNQALFIPHERDAFEYTSTERFRGSASRTGSPEPPCVVMDKPRFTVLVVDDEISLRRLMMRTLKAIGVDSIGAADGAAGLKAFLAGRERIDLVILDLMMPGMSGLDLAAELERRRPGVKILYISGLGASIAMECILRQAADRVLVKPFTQQALAERVAQLLAMDKGRSVRATRNLDRESA